MAVEITDEMIQRLAKTWVASIPLQYPEPKHPHRFSLRFHLKMPLLHKAKKRAMEPIPHRGRQLAAALLAAALMTVTVAMAVPAIREKVFKMVRDVYEKYSHIHYEQVGPVEESPSSEEFTPYHLTYIPEGFSLVEDRTTESSHREQFNNTDGLWIIMNQSWVEEAEFSLDTENKEPEKIILPNNTVVWYLDNQSLKVIYWDDGRYSFRIFSHLGKDELVKIANSVK